MRDSRTRQGEISSILGDQVRLGVERLLRGVEPLVPADQDLAALYQAAIRVVMRVVVLFFAESERRRLLPRGEPAYDEAYGVEGLLAQLRAARHENGAPALREQEGAWPRLIALFRLVHGGGDLGTCQVRAYGGELFRPGNPDSEDPVLRAVAIPESAAAQVHDLDVLELLDGLKYTELRLPRQGPIPAAVEFSDQDTEYIGILYEGLTDYELRRVAPEEKAMVRLRIGLEPFLPLARLQQMSAAERRELLKRLKKEKARGPAVEAAEDEEEPAAAETAAEAEAAAEEEETAAEAEEVPADERLHQEALQWAAEAVEAAGWVGAPRGRRARIEGRDEQVRREARRLVGHHEGGQFVFDVYAPGQFYLVRWGGTREGSGTFYTKRSLAEPTVRRTLEPLCYEVAPDGARKPRTPEEILALKVCDPACGSGSFLVSALRYLADALAEAIEARVREHAGVQHFRLPDGRPAEQPVLQEEIALLEDGCLTDRSRARLRRYVAQRCLYGVDLNPVAVALARVSLWIETTDPELPFELFAHHIRCGNALMGAWLDQIQDYPLLAWAREAGDGDKGPRTRLLKETRKTVKQEMLRELERILRAEAGHAQGEFFRGPELPPLRSIVEEALDAVEDMNALPVSQPEERERLWREEIETNPHLRELRRAFDRWCAVWSGPPPRASARAGRPRGASTTIQRASTPSRSACATTRGCASSTGSSPSRKSSSARTATTRASTRWSGIRRGTSRSRTRWSSSPTTTRSTAPSTSRRPWRSRSACSSARRRSATPGRTTRPTSRPSATSPGAPRTRGTTPSGRAGRLARRRSSGRGFGRAASRSFPRRTRSATRARRTSTPTSSSWSGPTGSCARARSRATGRIAWRLARGWRLRPPRAPRTGGRCRGPPSS